MRMICTKWMGMDGRREREMSDGNLSSSIVLSVESMVALACF